MSNSKMSQVIKTALELTDTVLGRPATRSQVIQVIELIESFYSSVKPASKGTAAVATKAKPPTKVNSMNARSKSLRRPYTKPSVIIKWSELNWWLDEILDGNSHVIGYKELAAILPIHQMNAQAIETKLRKEARVKGYKKVKVNFDRHNGKMTVHAIK